MSYELIRLEIDGPVAELILARPEARNAMTHAMGREIRDGVAQLKREKRLRVLLVRGEGKAFSGGGDLFELLEERAGSSPDANRREMLAFFELYLSILELEIPVVAVLHGSAIGAGICFALACDIRLAAAGTKIGFPFVRMGLHPGMGTSFFLPRLVGPGKAAELVLTGRVFDAEEAREMGLVGQVHPEDQLLPAARALAREIASAAPLSVRQTKQSLRHSFGRSLRECLLAEADALAVDFAAGDVREAIRAFKEKRAPVFRDGAAVADASAASSGVSQRASDETADAASDEGPGTSA